MITKSQKLNWSGSPVTGFWFARKKELNRRYSIHRVYDESFSWTGYRLSENESLESDNYEPLRSEFFPRTSINEKGIPCFSNLRGVQARAQRWLDETVENKPPAPEVCDED
jgi:hypothetical protein